MPNVEYHKAASQQDDLCLHVVSEEDDEGRIQEKRKLMELCLDQRGSPSNRQNCRLTNVRERAATKICPEDNTTGKQKHDETVDV